MTTGCCTPNEINPQERALALVYGRYATALRAHLFRLLREHETAEDLCQETFLRAWRVWSQGKAPQETQAWLYRVATNLAYDELRRRKRRPQALLSATGWDDLDGGGFEHEVLNQDAVCRLLRSLHPLDAALLVAQFVHDDTIGELARRLGWPEGTVKSRTSRARARLRQLAATDQPPSSC